MEGLYPHSAARSCSATNAAGVVEQVGSDVTYVH